MGDALAFALDCGIELFLQHLYEIDAEGRKYLRRTDRHVSRCRGSIGGPVPCERQTECVASGTRQGELDFVCPRSVDCGNRGRVCVSVPLRLEGE